MGNSPGVLLEPQGSLALGSAAFAETISFCCCSFGGLDVACERAGMESGWTPWIARPPVQ